MSYDSRQPPQLTDIIAKAATKGKFLDLRNNLVLADPNEYAMLHGIGGAKHAPKSTIRMVITDYSAGAKENSITVHANVTPELIPYLLEVCKKNVTASTPAKTQGGTNEESLTSIVSTALAMGTELPPDGSGVSRLAVPAATMRNIPSVKGFNPQADAVFQRLRREATELPPDANTGAAYVSVSKAGLEELLRTQAVPTEPSGEASPGGVNYTYRQERVNVYRQENGLVPVSILTISREGTRKNGEVSRMPWTVKIQNFLARPVSQRGGTTSYNSQSKQKVTEAFVQLSDFDMFRCLYRASRFIEIWEVNYGTGLITEGLRRKDAQRAAGQQQGGMNAGSGIDMSPDDCSYYENY